jgi:sulfatase modifying factor 1
VAPDWADRPVNYVSWGDAARFANWLHNGQPTGPQDLTTTEDGSYLLDGAATDAELLAIERGAEATWVIPSEDESYKAAYHYNDGVSGNYFEYATGTDSVPSNDLDEPTDPGNNVTFNDGGYTTGSPYYRTEVGAHENSYSPYGTFDQCGNVWEWNEVIIGSSYRGVRGGSFNDSEPYLRAAFRNYLVAPTYEYYGVGFRVADVSGPTCEMPGDVDGSTHVDGNDIPGFVRVKLGTPELGDNEDCADYGTGTLEGDIAEFVAGLLL